MRSPITRRGGPVAMPVALLAALVLSAATVAIAADTGRAVTGPDAHDPGPALGSVLPANPFAYVPPQCYTKTVDAAGDVHNPCYICHVASRAPNYASAPELQLAYDFPAPARANPWTNLFVDRRDAVDAMSDAGTLDFVRSDNYHGADGLTLARRLATPPPDWDVNGDERWSGYRPDIWFDFDGAGYDRAPDGARTGWRAFAYLPLPGSFWPSNGSADDVAIRLPEVFRQTVRGETDWRIYDVNLAIVESLIKRADVPTDPVDEASLGVDLDRDGTLGLAHEVVFAFDPRAGVTMSYVGRARDLQAEGTLHLAAGLYPEGTEFVHSLRYLDVAPDGGVGPAARLKELRYARKTAWNTYWDLRERSLAELRERRDAPDRPERFSGDVESGIATGQGWRLQGFIEDANGELRPQTFEESLTCAGCHAGVARTVDDTFAYARKIDEPSMRRGWYAWNAANPLGALRDGVRPDGRGEYATYLERNGAGDEFRANADLIEGFRGDDVGARARRELASSIAALVMPDAERAMAMNKAYRLIVEEQSFALGRQPVVAPLQASVHREVEAGLSTGIDAPVE